MHKLKHIPNNLYAQAGLDTKNKIWCEVVINFNKKATGVDDIIFHFLKLLGYSSGLIGGISRFLSMSREQEIQGNIYLLYFNRKMTGSPKKEKKVKEGD